MVRTKALKNLGKLLGKNLTVKQINRGVLEALILFARNMPILQRTAKSSQDI